MPPTIPEVCSPAPALGILYSTYGRTAMTPAHGTAFTKKTSRQNRYVMRGVRNTSRVRVCVCLNDAMYSDIYSSAIYLQDQQSFAQPRRSIAAFPTQDMESDNYLATGIDQQLCSGARSKDFGSFVNVVHMLPGVLRCNLEGSIVVTFKALDMNGHYTCTPVFFFTLSNAGGSSYS